MKKFGERLKAARERRDWSQNELARRSGVGQGQISRLEQGDRPPAAVWKLAQALQVRPVWLARNEGPMELPDLSEARVAVPHYDVEISAGPGAIIGEEARTGLFTCPVDVLRRYASGSQSFALVTARGDSMEETIRDGEMLLIDLSVQKPTKTGIYVVVVGEETLVKRLHHAGRSLIVGSDNSAYEPLRLGRRAASQVRVVGKAVAVLRRL